MVIDDGQYAPPLQKVIVRKAWQSFNNFGYKKTTMDDVARAAGVSRQTVYAHFPNKEALLCAVAELGMTPRLKNFESCLHDREISIEDRLIKAFSTSLADLTGTEVAEELSAVGEKYEKIARETTIEMLTRFLENTYISRRWAKVGLTPKILASNLVIVSRGIRDTATSPEEYRMHIRAAVLLLCVGSPVL